MEHLNWEMIFRWVGGGSALTLATLLLKHFVVSAPVKFAANSKSDGTLIVDLQTRVGNLEIGMAQLRKLLTRTTRERDALSFANDANCSELRVSALMHEKNERPGSVLIEKWKAARNSETVLHDLKPDEGEAEAAA